MKIVTVLGSPRKRGNTVTVLKAFEDRVKAPHRLERVNLVDYVINGCLGCNACQKKLNEAGCVQKDDAVMILNKHIAADVIIYATPLYVWSFSAQMKALLNRQYCLVKWNATESSSLFEGKRTALLVTCGGTEENDADLIKETFDRAMAYAHCEVVGKYVVPDCTLPKALGDKAEKTAAAMFRDIGLAPMEQQVSQPLLSLAQLP